MLELRPWAAAPSSKDPGLMMEELTNVGLAAWRPLLYVFNRC